ncbi:MAG: threonine/serine exporter family protein [Muribaculaceae bacterium]|nr:threonine/serine exporter family protein [Muribaculaceae bacterium]
MTTATTCDTALPDARRICTFLSEYTASLAGCGATCIRIEKNVERIAAAYGMSVEIAVMPRHIHLSVWSDCRSEVVTAISSPKAMPVSFSVNTGLSRLSWDIADGRTSFDEACARLDAIAASDSQNKWFVLLAVSLANASFCRLFGGDPQAMAVVGVATAAGYWLKGEMLGRHFDLRLTVFVCAFVSAVVSAAAMLFSLGNTPLTAIGTSVLYLVPGIPFLNSFSDLVYRHYICSVSRFIDAAVTTCCLSAGLCAAMLLMRAGMF